MMLRMPSLSRQRQWKPPDSSGVTQQGRETLVAESVMQGLLGFDRIGLGTAVDHQAEDQMIGGVAEPPGPRSERTR